MNASEIIKNIEAEQLKADAPQFSVGDTVKVYGKIKEGNRERIQVFEGTVIKKQGGSNRATFTVRKLSNGVENPKRRQCAIFDYIKKYKQIVNCNRKQ